MKHKSAPIHGFKALTDEGPGIFEAVVSVFGNVDFAGDRVLFGAFSKSLDRWKTSGDPIPVVFSHQWDDLDAHVGKVLEARELAPGAPELVGTPIAENGGLWIKGALDVEEDFAGRLWKRLTERRIREFSFAYDVLEERTSSDGANDLVELDVIEVGPTLKGMNPATVLLTAKSLARRVLEAKSDDLEELERMIADELEQGSGAKSTPPHAFIPKEDDPDRCTVCDLTRSTVAHLHTLSDEPGGAKAVVHLAGSVEERLERLHAAGLEAIDVDQANGGFYELAIEGTFDDRVVFRLEGWNDPLGGGSFFECSIVSEDGDAVELGAPVEVVVEGVTRAKTLRVGVDETRGSALKAELLRTLGRDGNHSGKANDKVEDPSGGKAEDPTSRTGSETGTTGEPSRALLEIELFELDAIT